MKTITYNLSTSSITNVLRVLRREQNALTRKMNELCMRLATIGATVVSFDYSGAFYVGDKDVSISVEPTEDNNGYKIVASGQAVAFIEFGAGARYGGGYPEPQLASTYATPGSWSTDLTVGKGHWADPNGWYLPNEKVGLSGEKHSYGNPPSAGMYHAGQEIREQIDRIAKEVFGK